MRRDPDWRGIVAVLIVVGVFTVLAIAALYAGRNPERVVSSEEVATVSTVLGAGLGAVAAYIGSRRGPPDPPQPPASEPPAPPGAEPGITRPPGPDGPTQPR